jgi:hypothetical protein
MASSDIQSFLQKIMDIRVLSLGGASAGIFGISGADNETLNNLKKSTVAFVKEYSSKAPNKDVLMQSSQEIEGYLRVLQLTNTISKDTVDQRIEELGMLSAKVSDQ